MPLPPEEWTEPEKWVWEQVRTGKEADFNERYGNQLDPKNESLWVGKEKERRTLRPDFLRTILLSEPWQGLITNDGVLIIGALFAEAVNLSFVEVRCVLGLAGCRLEGGMFCLNTYFKHSLSMRILSCEPNFEINSASITGDLYLDSGRFASASMLGVRVGGNLYMQEVEINGALSLDGAAIQGNLFMGRGRYGNARLKGVQVGGMLSMTGAKFSGKLDAERAIISHNFLMRRVEGTTALLRGVQVGGQFILSAAVFNGELSLDGAAIGAGLFLDKGRFYSARMLGMRVGGQVAFVKSRFSDILHMEGSSIKGDLFLREGSFSDVRMLGVSVGGQLSARGAGFRGVVNCEGLHVQSHFLLDGAKLFKKLNLIFCKVEGGLNLTGAHLGEVDLSQARIAGALALSFPGRAKIISWYKGSFNLSHAAVGAVLDGQEDWPASLGLDGFRYTSLGSEKTMSVREELLHYPLELLEEHIPEIKEIEDAMEKRRFALKIRQYVGAQMGFTTSSDRLASWYVAWLERQKDFSMDPYQRCAKFLRESGQPDKANEVMYAGLERERKQLPWSLPRLGRSLLKWIIGYGLGYRYFLALVWAVLFLCIGAVVCGAAGGDAKGALFCLGFSLDNMLPLIDLRPEHEAMSVALSGFPKFYFLFVQQIVGWVLVLCVAAGLAGVGKPGGRD